MNRYKVYKETGFEWIGKIPRDWEIFRISKFFNERSEKVDDVVYPPLSVTMSGIVEQLSDVAKTNDGDNRKLVKKDDFVINSRSDRKGSSGIAPRDGSVSLINIVLEPHGLDPHFIQRLFKSYYFKEEYFRNGKGIHWDLWTTRWDQFKNINIPIPTIKEQKLISRYLDKKIEQIDKLIEKIQLKICLLDEKQTSLIKQYVVEDFVSNVGINYNNSEIRKKKIKYLFKIRKGVMPQILNNGIEKDNFPYLSMNVLRGGRPTEFTKIDNCVFVSKGDIGILWDGSNAGEILKMNLDGVLSSTAALLTITDPNLNQNFAFYVLKSYENLIKFNTNGMGIPHVDGNYLKNIEVYLPSIDIQKKVVNNLDRKLSKLTKLRSYHFDKFLLLKEYCQSLISSTVTGKVRITEDMV